MDFPHTMEYVEPGSTVVAEIAPGLPYKFVAEVVTTLDEWVIIAANDGGTWFIKAETPCEIT